MGYAFSRGRLDGAVARDEMLKHISEIAAATDLPVSADLENGYGDSPEIVSETIGLAASTGIVGCPSRTLPAGQIIPYTKGSTPWRECARR
jgi:2-methylisocitrate lyase-like PEP mutase family enzyme